GCDDLRGTRPRPGRRLPLVRHQRRPRPRPRGVGAQPPRRLGGGARCGPRAGARRVRERASRGPGRFACRIGVTTRLGTGHRPAVSVHSVEV
ncbi:MAG: Acylphosphate phosphohydrolase, putative, partial [uncultured Gemmatimonadaceae bacterium]